MGKSKKSIKVHHSDYDEYEGIQKNIKEMDERLRSFLTPHEGRIMWLQSLLVWEQPQYSAVLFVSVNIIFWLTTYLRTFYIIGIVGFCVTTWDLWSHYIWPEIRVPPPPNEDTEEWTPVHAKLMSVPEICEHLSPGIVYTEYYFHSAMKLRKQRPAKFFLFAMSFFICSGAFGCYIPGIYLVYFSLMGVLLLPMVFYHDLHTKFQESVSPYISKMEDSMNIKRKRSKKSKKKGGEGTDTSTQDFSDSDEELKSFLPEPIPRGVEEGSQLLLRIPSVKDSDSDTGLTPRLTPNPPDASIFPGEEYKGELLPEQMPSITGFEDSLSLDPQYALQSPSQLTLGDSDNDTLAEGLLEEDFEVDGKFPTKNSSQKEVSLHRGVLKKAHTAPSASLEFDSEHFDDSDSGPVKKKKKKSTKKGKEEEPTLEDELAQGLEFDFDDDQQQNEGQEKSRQGQLMGNLLAGAMTGAHSVQDTVANIVASHMVSSIMQNTVSGLNLLGGSVGLTRHAPVTAETQNNMEEKGSREQQSIIKEKGKVQVQGQGSQESNDIAEEFEFLNEEDFDSVEGQSNNS